MSHFSEIKTEFKDQDSLIDALVVAGVPRDWIEKHLEPQQICDYKGNPTKYRWQDTQDKRFKSGDKAHVIIRRSHLGSGHNDLGFYVSKTDESFALICDWARQKSGYNDKWLSKVRQQYAVCETEKHYARLGKKVHKVQEGGKIHLYIKAA